MSNALLKAHLLHKISAVCLDAALLLCLALIVVLLLVAQVPAMP